MPISPLNSDHVLSWFSNELFFTVITILIPRHPVGEGDSCIANCQDTFVLQLGIFLWKTIFWSNLLLSSEVFQKNNGWVDSSCTKMILWESTPWELCTQIPCMPAPRHAEVRWERQGNGVRRGEFYPQLHFSSSYMMSRKTPHLWCWLPQPWVEQPRLAAPYMSSHCVMWSELYMIWYWVNSTYKEMFYFIINLIYMNLIYINFI